MKVFIKKSENTVMSNKTIKCETYIHKNKTATKALIVLKGLLEGMKCDGKLNDLEIAKIKSWTSEYSFLKIHSIIKLIFNHLEATLEDHALTLGEAQDLIWMIDRNLKCDYDEITILIQELQGIVSGIAADNIVSNDELIYLWNWLNQAEALNGIFPYDEIYSMIIQVGTKKIITEQQSNNLIKAFSWTESKSIDTNNPFIPWTTDPTITFPNKNFCVSGLSEKYKRYEIIKMISSKAGLIKESVSSKTDYLVICPQPNIAWTHATYGRKIEQAINLRRKGANLTIIQELDLLDAILD